MKIMTEKLILEKIDSIAKITINNPSANTWDLESLAGLKEIIQHLNNCLLYTFSEPTRR